MLIDKTLVQYWDQGKPPEDVANLLCTWRDHNPEYDYFCFDKKSAKEFLSENYGEEVVMLFDKANLPAMRSDIFRVAYILRRGGVYVDAATECKLPIDRALNGSLGKLTILRKWHGGIWNGFIAANKGDEFLKAVWHMILHNLEKECFNDVWQATGPGVFNKIYGSNHFESIEVIDQHDAKKYFVLVNNLSHKGDSHWSKVQEKKPIFNNGVTREDKRGPSGKVERGFKVIAHFGPHKTGTTFFQNFLEANEGKVEESGYSLITVRSSFSAKYTRWRETYTKKVQGFVLGRVDEEELEYDLRHLFLELKEDVAENKSFFLSDENLLGPMPGHFFASKSGREKHFYTAGKIVLRAFYSAFSGNIERVVLCKRDMRDFLVSTYRDFVGKLSSSEDFNDYVGVFSNELSLDIDNFYSEFLALFGSVGKVYDFTDFVARPCEIGAELVGCKSFDGEVVLNKNDSMDWRAVDLSLAIAPFLTNDEEKISFSLFLKKNIKGGESRVKRQVDRYLMHGKTL